MFSFQPLSVSAEKPDGTFAEVDTAGALAAGKPL
jgi:hypothetical protein